MDLKLVIVGTFCLLVNQSQALDWERDGNQFDVEESDLQAQILPSISATGCVGELHMTLIEIRTENRQSVMNVTHTDNTRNRDELKNMKPKVNLTQNNYRFFLTITGPCCWELCSRPKFKGGKRKHCGPTDQEFAFFPRSMKVYDKNE